MLAKQKLCLHIRHSYGAVSVEINYNSLSAIQELSLILWNRKFPHHIQQGLQLIHILNHGNQVHSSI
jgi:hypothetical protein